MGRYSIKELEKLSGIKAHTIRIWEKRYQLIEPARTSTNIRFYSDDDLKKIINVSVLNNNGIKISRIAELSNDEIAEKVIEITEHTHDITFNIDNLLIALVDLEEETFEKSLGTFILRYGFEKTITEIVYPFLQRIGILWQTKNITPAHEHFISNLIRQKLIVAIDGLPVPPKTARRIVLFLPEGEMHELGLLFSHYLSRKAGFRTYYLGQNLPYEDLAQVVKMNQPEFLITSVTSPLNLPHFFSRLESDFPEIKVLASGMQVLLHPDVKASNVQVLSNALEINKFLR